MKPKIYKMKISRVLFVIFALSILSRETIGQNIYPPKIEGAKEINFKTIDNVQLNLWIFNPSGQKANDKTSAIIFFFGGGWNSGSPVQFVPHCEYLAARGMVAIVADYRVFSRNNVRVNKCVSDAKSAIRWVREHASQLGVDTDKIAAGGGSAGGHLAASTATLSEFDEPTENLHVSSKPNALVLFNPALIVAPVEIKIEGFENKMENMEERMGAKPESMSPFHNVAQGTVPTIIFHGTDDTTVPFVTAQLYSEKMNSLGNSCKLIAYEGESHGFFNFGNKSNGAFIDTVNKMDQFLVSLGYLKPPPRAFEVK